MNRLITIVCVVLCAFSLLLVADILSADDGGLGAIKKAREQKVACTFACSDSSRCDFTIEIRDSQGNVVESEEFENVPFKGSRTLVYGGPETLVSCDIGDDSSEDNSSTVRNPSWTVLDNRGGVVAMGSNNDSSSSSDEDSDTFEENALGPVWNSSALTPICMTKCSEESTCDFTMKIRDEDGKKLKSKTFMGVPERGSRKLAYGGGEKRIFCTVVDHSGDTQEDSAALVDSRGNVVAYMTATE